MMHEVASDEQGITDHLAHTNIAQQLQEAAKTDVTQGERACAYLRIPEADVLFKLPICCLSHPSASLLFQLPS